MSVLLRRPATVPALFSCAVEPDPPASRASASPWGRVGVSAVWVLAVLMEVPLVKGAAASVALALPH